MACQDQTQKGFINIVKNMQVQPFQTFITERDLLQCTDAVTKISDAYSDSNKTELLFDLQNMPTKVVIINRDKYNTFESFWFHLLGILANIEPAQVNVGGVTLLTETHAEARAAQDILHQFVHLRNARKATINELVKNAKY